MGSCSGTFFAFAAGSGEILWQYDTAEDGASAQFHGDALVTDELVVVGSDARPTAHLYAFERSGGTIRWKHPFPGGVVVDVRRHGDTALAVSATGQSVAVDLASGEIVWWAEPEKGPETRRQTDPALSEGRYVVARGVGRLETYDATTGAAIWGRELPATPNTSVAAVEDSVVVGMDDGRLLKFAGDPGEPAKELAIGSFLYGDLVLAGDCLLALVGPEAGEEALGHELACVEPDLGGVRWRYTEETPGAFGTFEPLVRGHEVVVGVEGKLVGLSLTDGSVLWSRSVRGLPRGLGASPSMLYVGTLGGTITAWPWP